MTNKTLASWSLGLTVGLFLCFFAGLPDTNEGIWNFLALAYFIATIWTGIRLYKTA